MAQLDQYLDTSQARLRLRFAARGGALIALLAAAVTLVFAVVFVSFVPTDTWVLGARVAVYSSLGALLILLVRRRFRATEVAAELERRVPEFGGRLSTWQDAELRGSASPLQDLLADETGTLAARHPPEVAVRFTEIAIPAAVALLLCITLLVWLAGGTSIWQLAGQRLWTGELLSATAPRIEITPGDVVVPRGADVVVEATALGFDPAELEVYARFENEPGWESAPMARLAEGRHGFVFVAVNEGLDYYVGAAGLNSPRHRIAVADLPRVTAVALTHTYPEWTGLPVSEHDGGDVHAVSGTTIEATIELDTPASAPFLVVDGEATPIDGSATSLAAEFFVDEPGEWHVAVEHEGQLAQISDTFFIDVRADAAPTVEFVFPGRDRQATSIEEVHLRFVASDDFGVTGLTLAYSVNGAAWTRVPLRAADPDANAPHGPVLRFETSHPLALETLRYHAPAATDSPVAATRRSATSPGDPPPRSVAEPERALAPGDMISFYVEASDRGQTTRTALYFVDVRPFDRTYRESQAMAGGGGPGGGGFEIAERQREIVSATWNLINEGDAAEARVAADRAAVLALLERTLLEQVKTLTERAAARNLTGDAEIDTFTQALLDAAEDMLPAAEMLEAARLEEAITPAQRALQHLLAAQATVTDVDVAMSRASGRGSSGGGLSELVDLELDPERNRYETPQSPGASAQAQDDEQWRTLAELAERQLELAEQQRNGADSLASRWQQERLRRELDELREQLEQRRGGAQQQRGRGTSGDPIDEAIAELDRARDAIDETLAERRGGTDRAGQALRRAAEALHERSLETMDEELARAGRQIANLLSDQRQVLERLEALEQETLNAARRGEASTLRNFEMAPYAERKRRMQGDVANLTRDLAEAGEASGDPETRRVLEQALGELSEERVDERLAAVADAFELGRPLFARTHEETVERALERLAERVEQARRMLEASPATDATQTTLARVRATRQALARSGGNPAGGDLTTAQLDALLRETQALERQVNAELGPTSALDTTAWREAYAERGTADANDEVLTALARAHLDQMEAALVSAAPAPPMRAQTPRDSDRDSATAARYFRSLSETPD